VTDTVVNLRRSTSPARPPAPVSFSPADLASINAGFEAATATEIVAWAVEQFHPALSLASSMTDAVLIDLAWRVEPSIEVVFIDTGYHFPETLQTLEQVRRHYGLNLKVMTVAAHDQELWRIDPENCCSSVKVGQLDRALAGRAAWMSGLRRAESPSRAGAPLVANDVRGLVKINPLATWDDDDVARYIADHSVPVNPLLEQGYHSIGCAPCTAPVLDGAGPRSGRWSESDKSECGLHL
jgi:phosphoadenosine phosphosulfate reductase